VIANPLRARDTALAAGALRALGSEIKQSRTTGLSRLASRLRAPRLNVDLGNAGTVMRFVPALAALTSAVVFFDGDERIRLRPIGPILEALRQLGAQIEDGGRAAVPFTVHGRGAVRGGTVVLDCFGVIAAGLGPAAGGAPVRRGHRGQARGAAGCPRRRTSR